jgi:predicted nucleotidyltransferase component of viral defense system
MIRVAELKARAATEGLAERTIELDYVLGWLLVTLGQVPLLDRDLVFKGGTALRKVYVPEWRYSEDLDFTVRGDLTPDDVVTAVQEWCAIASAASGLKLGPMELEARPAGIAGRGNLSMKVPFVGPLAKTARPRQVKLDVSFAEPIVLAPQRRALHVVFSDQREHSVQILVYAIEEVLAEKLRSLVQRREPRDLYDAWRLLLHREVLVDVSAALRIYPDKCVARRVEPSRLDEVLDDVLSSTVAQTWERRLGHQIRELPPIEQVVRELKRVIRQVMR